MAQVKNISNGPRGAYLDGVLHIAQIGQVIEADDYPDEWFEEVDGDGELDGMKVADLKALAEAEEIDLGDATKKADIIAAIELAREAAGQE
jgi:hypothetical protein